MRVIGVHPPPSPVWADFSIMMGCSQTSPIAVCTLKIHPARSRCWWCRLDTPCTSIQQAVERDTPWTTHCWDCWWIHPARPHSRLWKGIYPACLQFWQWKGIHHAHAHCMRHKQIHPHVYNTSGGKENTPTSTLLTADRDTRSRPHFWLLTGTQPSCPHCWWQNGIHPYVYIVDCRNGYNLTPTLHAGRGNEHTLTSTLLTCRQRYILTSTLLTVEMNKTSRPHPACCGKWYTPTSAMLTVEMNTPETIQ